MDSLRTPELKHAVRKWVSPRLWAAAGRVKRRALDVLSDQLAAIFYICVSWAPDLALVRLRERLTLIRRLDSYDHELYLMVTSDVESLMRLKSCRKEPETVAWLDATFKSGDVLYDVGANVGAYSLVAARIGGQLARVVAFEPGYRTFSNLVDNVNINGLEKSITPLPIALAEHTQLSSFTYSSVSSGSASHPGLQDGPTEPSSDGHRVQTVVAAALDDIVVVLHLPPPTHLKIDVDGTEISVLRGARAVLRAPGLRFIMIEIDHRNADARSIEDFIVDAGFRLSGRTVHSDTHTSNCLYERAGLGI